VVEERRDARSSRNMRMNSYSTRGRKDALDDDEVGIRTAPDRPDKLAMLPSEARMT